MIFIQNVPFTTKNTGDGLFCIYHNNSMLCILLYQQWVAASKIVWC
jgi:hypothetical protein